MQHNFKPYERVLVRSGADGVWCADTFSHATKEFVWLCSHSCYTPSCVIPYEGNEHLLGTTDDPTPEPEFQWGEHVEVLCNNEWCRAIYLWKSACRGHIVLLDDKATVVVPYSFSTCRHADW